MKAKLCLGNLCEEIDAAFRSNKLTERKVLTANITLWQLHSAGFCHQEEQALYNISVFKFHDTTTLFKQQQQSKKTVHRSKSLQTAQVICPLPKGSFHDRHLSTLCPQVFLPQPCSIEVFRKKAEAAVKFSIGFVYLPLCFQLGLLTKHSLS